MTRITAPGELKIYLLVAGLILPLPGLAYSQTDTHQTQVSRLAEILGALHHLREICGNNERQLWRDQMVALIGVEEPDTASRIAMTQAFNRGYNDFRRTYSTCTPSAKTVSSRFFQEGDKISKALSNHLQIELDAAQKKSPASQSKTAKSGGNSGG